MRARSLSIAVSLTLIAAAAVWYFFRSGREENDASAFSPERQACTQDGDCIIVPDKDCACGSEPIAISRKFVSVGGNGKPPSPPPGEMRICPQCMPNWMTHQNTLEPKCIQNRCSVTGRQAPRERAPAPD